MVQRIASTVSSSLRKILCACIEKKNAEGIRQKLAKEGLLDGTYIPTRDDKYVYFAVKGKLPAKMKVKTVQKDLQKRGEQGKSLREELAGKLTGKEMDELTASFDIVGDIAVLEIPAALVKKEKLIAAAVLKNHRNIRTVVKKTGGTAGEFRIRPVKVIAGERRTSAIYREGGCSFELNLNKTYFSPRLGTERGRIASQVGNGEKVLIPFAGVGPFAIRIAKREPTATVVGIELNHDAADYFERNIARNGCQNATILHGDVKVVLPGRFLDWADRVAMPHPTDGKRFLQNIIPCLKKGGVLHYYSFGDAQKPYGAAEKEVKDAAKKLGRKAHVLFRRVVRPFSKTTVQVVIDAKIM